MKLTPDEINRALETVVEENEAQKTLRRALAVLGSNGEHWCKCLLHDGRGNYCSIGALEMASEGRVDFSAMPYLALKAATTNEIGSIIIENDTASNFFTVRDMFLRAIEIAGGSREP